MRIIIIGAGKVGYKIAEMLSYRNNDVLVIEQDPERLQIIEEKLDVQAVFANGASPTVLKENGVVDTDLVIAVTQSDEVNIIAAFFAKKLGAKKTIARIRNPEYLLNGEIGFDTTLGIDLVINPDYVTAVAISELIDAPEAIESEYYAGGKIQLLALRLPPKAPAVNKKLKELPSPNPYLIVAIQRGEKMLIPRGEDRLFADDLVFVLASSHQMEHVEHLLGQRRTRVERIVILGGSRVAYYLAQKLKNKRIELKIIEKDRQLCEILSEKLPRAVIIHGDGSDLSLLEEEDVGKADLFVAATGDDEVNLLVCLLVKSLGAKKVIAKLGRSDYSGLLEKVGIDVAISPRLLTAATILKYVMQGEIVAVSLIGQDKAEMIEFVVPPTFRFTGKPLKQLNFPRNAIIGALARGDEVIVPGGNDTIMAGDHVIVFALPQAVANVQNFLGTR